MNNALKNTINIDKDLTDGFTSNTSKGKLPKTLPSPLYLNLGCGLDVREDFLNIDLFSNDDRVINMDVRKLDFPNNSVDLILASDILEHFSHHETDAILTEWARVLKPGGILIIRCPSLRLQVKAYTEKVWNADIASYMIFGGQTNPGDFHCNAFDEDSITNHLNKSGFEVLSFEEVDTPQTQGFINLNMTVKAKKIEEKSIEKVNTIEKKEEEITTYISDEVQTPSLNIVWEGSQFVYNSLALINREHCLNIIKSNVAELTIIPYEHDNFTPDVDARFNALQSNDIRYKEEVSEEISQLPYVWIRHQWPPKDEVPRGAKWIINQPWEFSLLPKKIVNIFNKADEIWTPSNFSRKAFVDSGIEFDKVQVIPNGVNPDIFTPKGEAYKLNTEKRFKFLFVGGTTYRKGFDVLLMAYIKAFTKDDDVCLVVKATGTKTYYRNQTMESIIDKVRENPNCPEIIYLEDDNFTENELASLYHACDTFVLPYRGEGFSLPTLEAMACGLPVVVTRGGATDDFTNDDTAWYINSNPKSIGDSIDGDTMVGETFILEPDLNELVETFQHLYNTPENNFKMGLIASYVARKQWSWNRASLKMLSRLDYLYDTDMQQKARKVLKETEDTYILLGQAETEFNDENFEEAKKLYILTLEDDNLEDKFAIHCLNRLAELSIRNTAFVDAYKYIEAAKVISQENPETIWLESIILNAEEKYVESLEKITKIVENWNSLKHLSTLGLNLSKYLLQMADTLVLMEEYADALEVYTTALAKDNYSPEACFGLGMCYKKANIIDEAKKMFEWALKYNPNYEAAKQELLKLNEEIDKTE